MIELQGVRKVYGRSVAVDRIDLTIGAGEMVGLIGHNGAGKSTVLKMLAGQLLPTEGTVRVGGIDVREDPAGARRKLGYVPEEPALYDYLTAREFLELVVAVRGGGDIEAALEMTGLGADADRLIREYSQGMRRKTALAAAVVSRPPVIVLDEALNGLDPPSAARVKAALRQLCDDGATVLLSTHILETVERVAGRVVMLAHGRVVADEQTADLGAEGLERMFLQRIAETAAG
ncbi:MAG: ABC transporter ATP-binding protein [Pseudomonadota bacterium]|nr:ABC transporter ATP-binding protein [Pseudomonadota bacterium]